MGLERQAHTGRSRQRRTSLRRDIFDATGGPRRGPMLRACGNGLTSALAVQRQLVSSHTATVFLATFRVLQQP